MRDTSIDAGLAIDRVPAQAPPVAIVVGLVAVVLSAFSVDDRPSLAPVATNPNMPRLRPQVRRRLRMWSGETSVLFIDSTTNARSYDVPSVPSVLPAGRPGRPPRQSSPITSDTIQKGPAKQALGAFAIETPRSSGSGYSPPPRYTSSPTLATT